MIDLTKHFGIKPEDWKHVIKGLNDGAKSIMEMDRLMKSMGINKLVYPPAIPTKPPQGPPPPPPPGPKE